MYRIHRCWVLLGISLSFLLGGCKNPPKVVTPPPSQLPDWVIKGSGAFEGDRGKAIYGVGARSNISNYARLLDASRNAARVEIAKVLNAGVSNLVKDYFKHVGTNEANQEEQLFQEVSRVYTEAQLSGVQIVNTYHDAATNTLYTLAMMDFEAFKDVAKKASALKQEVREFIEKNAEVAFSELDAMKSK